MPVDKDYRQRGRKKRRWRIVFVSFVCLMGAVAIGFAYFIYQNIFAALSNTYTAGLLQTTAYIDVVDSAAYDRALTAMDLKKKIANVKSANLINPFIERHATSTKKTGSR